MFTFDEVMLKIWPTTLGVDAILMKKLTVKENGVRSPDETNWKDGRVMYCVDAVKFTAGS